MAGVLRLPNLPPVNGVATIIPLVVEVPPTLGTWSLLICNVVVAMAWAEVAHLEMLSKLAKVEMEVEAPTMELPTGDSSLLHSLLQLLDLQVRLFFQHFCNKQVNQKFVIQESHIGKTCQAAIVK